MRFHTIIIKSTRAAGLMLLLLSGGGFLGLADGEESLSTTAMVASRAQVISDSPPTSGPLEQSATSVQALAISENGVIYAGSFGHGVFQTMDRGATWNRVGAGVTDPFILSLAITKNGIVYAGTFRGGVFRSRDEGNTWHSVNEGLKRLEVKALMVVGHELYAGTGDGVYRLRDADDRWVPMTTGLDDILVHSLARSTDGTLFAGTSGKGIFRLIPVHPDGFVFGRV